MKNEVMKQVTFDAFCISFLSILALIGIFSPSAEYYLDIPRYSVVVLMTYVAAIVVAVILKIKKVETLGAKLFHVPLANEETKVVRWYLSFSNWQLVVTLISTLSVGAVVTQFSFFELLNEDGFDGAIRLFQGLLSPNFEVLPRAILNITETIFMAFMATALSIPIAFILSFLAAKNVMRGLVPSIVYYLIRLFMNVSRSIEALIWAIIFSVWVGIGPFAGMLALMIHSIASLTKQYSEMIETVSDGPIEGVLATGANKIQMIWFAIVPQVVLPFISFTVYRWDINVRMATIIGLVGGGGIGTMLIQYQGQAMWNEVGCIILVIAVVVWAMDQVSSLLREALK